MKYDETQSLTDAILKLDNIDTEEVITDTRAFALVRSLTSNLALLQVIYESWKAENAKVYRVVEAKVHGVSEKLSADERINFETVPKLEFTRAMWKETLRLDSPIFQVLCVASKTSRYQEPVYI